MKLVDGEVRDERHYEGYTVRAHRDGESVEIFHVFESGFPYLRKEIRYEEFVKLTEENGGLVEAFA